MKIIVFGASGGTGQQVLLQALAQGHKVTAYVRDPGKIEIIDPNLTAIPGDVLEEDSVSKAVKGHDVVICVLGMPSISDSSELRSKGTFNIVRAMQGQGLRRLICLSAFGAGDSLQYMPKLYKYFLVPLFMRRLYADHNAQEGLVMQSGLDWTLLRPAILSNRAATGHYWTGEDLRGVRLKNKISRSDVAHCLVALVSNGNSIRKAFIASS